VCVVFLSCDAPRTNPLDPQDPNYNFGQLQGIVYIFNTRQPLQNVNVTWKKQNIIVQTDANGQFSIGSLYKNNGMLYYQKDGFAVDSVFVDWNNQSSKRLNDEYLNYSIGQVYGYVRNGQGTALSGVKVYLKSKNIMVQTNSAGYYHIDNLSRGLDSLQFQADGFSNITQAIIWGSGQNVEVDALLNNYTIGQVYGYLRTGQGKGIAGANVFLRSKNIVVQTNNLGYYHIDNLSRTLDSLLFQAAGFSSATMPIIWGALQNTEVDASLNSNPNLDSLRVYTSIQNLYASPSKSLLVIQAKVSDADNDIDSVFVKCRDLNFRLLLPYNFATGFFELTIQAGTVSYLSSLDDAVGKNFQIEVRDKAKRIFDLGSSFVTRIIKDQITFFSPANGATVNKNPLLSWRPFNPGFDFHYMVQVYPYSNFGGGSEPVWQMDNISKDSVQITLNANLTSGQNYYWIIWCIDDYQNRSSSTPATFTAK
jgi:Carboxypeptidase regulatory-like domain